MGPVGFEPPTTRYLPAAASMEEHGGSSTVISSLSQLLSMTSVDEMDVSPGRCDQCGQMLTVAESEGREWIMGLENCPECGSTEFSVLSRLNSG